VANVHFAREGELAILTLDSPPLNQIGEDLIADLLAALSDVEAEAGLRSLLLRGDGKVFSAGADVNLFSGLGVDEIRWGRLEASATRSRGLSLRQGDAEASNEPVGALVCDRAAGDSSTRITGRTERGRVAVSTECTSRRRSRFKLDRASMPDSAPVPGR
jgi:hypothetical protein